MKALLNNDEGLFRLYPENLLDIVKAKIIKTILPKLFSYTWPFHSINSRTKPSHYTIETEYQQTEYPTLCGGG